MRTGRERLDGGPMYRGQHKYTVELRVWAEDLDPELITRETGLQPCKTRYRGSPRGEGTWRASLWAFDGGYSGDWDSLSDGLVFLLDRLRGYEEFFQRYATKYEVVWWCGHFQSAFDCGPTLSHELLERLASFGAALFIDNYFSRVGTD